jgi:hypothetical protein
MRSGHTRVISAALLTTAPRASINAISTSKAPAELDRLAVGEQLVAMRQHPETTEHEARRRFERGCHRHHY